jgi:tetratricopeptide (TPR) repeat protein
MEETKNLAPFDVGLAFQLGVAYYQKGNYQKAKEELERAISITPDYANALYFLGLTYDQLGEREKAIEKFKRVSELNPDNEEVKKIISNLEAGKKALEGILPTVPPKTPIEEKPPEIKK